jgi:hypothetical protein
MEVLTEIVAAANSEDLVNKKEVNTFRHQFILNYLNQDTASKKINFTFRLINKLTQRNPDECIEQVFKNVLKTHIHKETNAKNQQEVKEKNH